MAGKITIIAPTGLGNQAANYVADGASTPTSITLDEVGTSGRYSKTVTTAANTLYTWICTDSTGNVHRGDFWTDAANNEVVPEKMRGTDSAFTGSLADIQDALEVALAANAEDRETLIDDIANASYDAVEPDITAIKNRTDRLPDEPAAKGDIINPTGNGARTVTITVTDGIAPLQGALVRMSKNADTAYGPTGADGTLVLNVNDGTWSVAITKAYYAFGGASLVVDGDKTPTYVMTQVVIPPAEDPARCNCYCTTYDTLGDVQPGVVITFRLVTPPPGSNGASYGAYIAPVTSDGSALLQVALVRGATYMAKRGEGEEVAVDVPDADTYQLPVVLSGAFGGVQ